MQKSQTSCGSFTEVHVLSCECSFTCKLAVQAGEAARINIRADSTKVCKIAVVSTTCIESSEAVKCCPVRLCRGTRMVTGSRKTHLSSLEVNKLAHHNAYLVFMSFVCAAC